MNDALKIINNVKPGFMVHLEHKEGNFLSGDYFPNKHAGEPLIPTEEEAWTMAAKFAKATVGKAVNIYVVGYDFRPVEGYQKREISNREPEPAPITKDIKIKEIHLIDDLEPGHTYLYCWKNHPYKHKMEHLEAILVLRIDVNNENKRYVRTSGGNRIFSRLRWFGPIPNKLAQLEGS